MSIKRKVIIALCIGLVATTNVGCKESSINRDDLEELKENTVVLGEYRQDEVEAILIEVISGIYTANSEEEVASEIEKIREIATDNVCESLKSNISVDKNNTNEILDIKCYYCSKDNSGDGRAKEYIDVKVGSNSLNKMYMVELSINDNGEIIKCDVWKY